MEHSTVSVRADFDRIAQLSEMGAAPEPLYLPWLLRQLPADCGDALEVGCGTGELTRHLARRASSVLALDLSPEMVRIARERVGDDPAVAFEIADVAAWSFPAERFDCIVSLHTLHHLPFERTVAGMREALRPGGTLLLLDLLDRSGPAFLPLNAAAALVQRLSVRRQPPELRRAYEEHGRGDVYPRPGEIRARFAPLLPGARVRHHLLWRYSVVWRKPAAGGTPPLAR